MKSIPQKNFHFELSAVIHVNEIEGYPPNNYCSVNQMGFMLWLKILLWVDLNCIVAVKA